MSMYEGPVVYVDIETSGSSSLSSSITEIGILRVENGEITDTFHSLVNPGKSLPYWITKITGLTDADLADAPFFQDVAYDVNRVMDGAVFIAHNVKFDYSFIKRELEAVGYSWRPKLLCTVRLSRALYPEHKGHSLEKIIARHNIDVSARHRAFDDAKAIMDFAQLAYAEKGGDAFALALAKQFKNVSLPPNLDESALNNVGNKPGVYVFEDAAGTPLYVGKSVTLRKRVLSHFNQATKENKEMKISKNTHGLKVIETGNELEALLLESKMVKELLPVYNKQLRRSRGHFVLMKDVSEHGYTTLSIIDQDLSEVDNFGLVYGMYPSRMKAKSALENALRTFELCPKLLGLDHSKEACFWYQLGKCKGACVSKEMALKYNLRVDIALERSRMENWPYSGPIALKNTIGDSVVIDKWVILGYLDADADSEAAFRAVERTFDLDTYKILRTYLRKHLQNLTIIHLGSDFLANFG